METMLRDFLTSDYTAIKTTYLMVSFAFPIISMLIAAIFFFTDVRERSKIRLVALFSIIGIGLCYVFSGISMTNAGIIIRTPKEEALAVASIENYEIFEDGDVVVNYKLPEGKKAISETYKSGDNRISIAEDMNAEIRREDGILYLPTKPYKQISHESQPNYIFIAVGIWSLIMFWRLSNSST